MGDLVSQINLQQHYQEILSAVAPLVKAKVEQNKEGNCTTIYMGGKYIAMHLKEKWLEVYFCDLKIIGNDTGGEWDKVLLSFYLGADATELETYIFVASVVAAIKTVYYWWVDGGKPLPQFVKESWNPKDGMPTRKELND